MAVALLEEWCKIMGVDVQKSLLVVNIPVDCGEPEVQTVLQEVCRQLPATRQDIPEEGQHQCCLIRTYGGHGYVCGPQ